MKRVISIALFLVLLTLGYQLYTLYIYNRELKEVFAVLSKKLESFKKESAWLKADLEYFSEPENIEKELRARFNLKKPGEKLIIVVPSKSEH